MRNNTSTKRGFTIGALIFAFILFVTAVSEIVFAMSFYNKNVSDKDKYTTVEATITDITITKLSDSYDYDVYVTYTYEGVTYENKTLNYYNSNMFIGKTENILCNKEYPDIIRSTESNNFLLLFTAIFAGGMIFMAVIITIVTLKPIKKEKYIGKALLKNGVKLDAVVETVAEVYDEETDRTVYNIICTYTDAVTGITYRFRSDAVLKDPRTYTYEGTSVEVYVNPKDYSQYYVFV